MIEGQCWWCQGRIAVARERGRADVLVVLDRVPVPAGHPLGEWVMSAGPVLYLWWAERGVPVSGAARHRLHVCGQSALEYPVTVQEAATHPWGGYAPDEVSCALEGCVLGRESHPDSTPGVHGLLRTPRTWAADGLRVAWCTCGREFRAVRLGDAHGAVLDHARPGTA